MKIHGALITDSSTLLFIKLFDFLLMFKRVQNIVKIAQTGPKDQIEDIRL